MVLHIRSFTFAARHAALLLALAAVPAAAAATIDVHLQRNGDTVLIEARALLEADAGTSWQVLTDYARYPAFIPGIRSSEVIARTGSNVTVAQTGDAVWLFGAPVHVVYEITEWPMSRVESRIASGCECTLESAYSLAPSGEGVAMTYGGRLTLHDGILTPIERAAAGRAVVREFRALAEEIERKAAR
ncbi:MAG TPA: SRPBCC family protein [Casimicrobiaceae bacterium]|jgi:hypothetical protein